MVPANRAAIEADGALLGLLKGKKQAHQGGLATAGGPHHGYEFARPDGECQAVDNPRTAVAVLKMHVIQRNAAAP
jgi:hypothetical protein